MFLEGFVNNLNAALVGFLTIVIYCVEAVFFVRYELASIRFIRSLLHVHEVSFDFGQTSIDCNYVVDAFNWD